MVPEMGGRITSHPLVLAIETSSRVGSVALAFGPELVAESRFSAPLKHSAEIFPAIRDLLARADRTASQVEHVYISVGPGSFSGLRIATTLAKMMSMANGARVVSVDTLDVVAANVADLTGTGNGPNPNPQAEGNGCERLAAILDAKRGHFFVAVYERQAMIYDAKVGAQNSACEPGVWSKVLADSLMTAPEFVARFVDDQKPIWLLGDGLVYYQDSFRADGVCFIEQAHWSPQARNVHALGWQMALRGQFVEPLALTPNYLRKPDITMKSR